MKTADKFDFYMRYPDPEGAASYARLQLAKIDAELAGIAKRQNAWEVGLLPRQRRREWAARLQRAMV